MDDTSVPVDRFGQALGRLVREAREWAGMTELAVEQVAGLEAGTVARVERGEAGDLSVHALRRIADAVDADPALLIPAGEAAGGEAAGCGPGSTQWQ